MRLLNLAAAAATVAAVGAAPSFVVQNNQFMLDGAPFTIKSGSFHYFRSHPDQWVDRLTRLKAMGLNTVQVYFAWNFHEVSPGVFDFASPWRNVSAFLQTAADVGLYVLARPGPYICGEHEFGAFPWWLHTVPGIKLRTNDTAYLQPTLVWWNAILSQLAPFTRPKGGNVLMTQIENEFGSYGNTGGVPSDATYLRTLAASARSILGPGAQLYTTDGGDTGYMTHGALPGEIYATGDGNGAVGIFQAEDAINPAGWRAHTSSEVYPGWLSHWGDASFANTSALGAAGDVNAFLYNNGSFNLYMGYGGTNFGFYAGANGGGTSYQTMTQSYDYNAPLAEGGTHGYSSDGDKYLAVRTVLAYWADAPLPDEPAPPVATAYGPVAMAQVAPLADNLGVLVPGGAIAVTGAPPTMEALNISRGWALYVANAAFTAAAPAAPAVKLATVSDLALVGGMDVASGVITPLGFFDRPTAAGASLPSAAGMWQNKGAYPVVLLENQGHINYGHGMDTDTKGWSGLTIGGASADVLGWYVYPLELHYADGWPAKLAWSATSGKPLPPMMPAFYRGTLTITGAPTDTFLATCGWGRGHVWINGFELGKYWDPRGPQHTLYVPAPILVSGANEILVLEVNGTSSDVSFFFTDGPDFTGKVCAQLAAAAAAGAPGDLASPAAVAAGASIDRDFAPAPVLAPAFAKAEVLAGASHADAREAAIKAAAAASGRSPAAARSSSAACNAPSVDTNLTLQPCATAGSAATVWTLVPPASGTPNAGRLALASNPALCAGVHGTNPDTGAPNVAAVACSAGPGRDRSQDWIWFPANTGALMHVPTGNMLDVPNSDSQAGARLELWASNGGNANQRFTWDAASGQLTSGLNGYCVAACA